ncbi:MAG TPA: hypothetical protein VLW85_16015 [Myxococcales bacterium]|nr:hypothetical protein [Myxococcales bacterium]
MSRVRAFLFAASMVVAAFVLPMGCELLGMDLAGRAWSAGRLTLPLLAQAGHVLAGLLGGALLGLLQWSLVPQARRRWIGAAALGGLGIGVARAVWMPLALLAAPVAGALAGFAQRPGTRWAKAQSLAAAWVALAVALPFPQWARAGLIFCAAVLSAWGVNIAP